MRFIDAFRAGFVALLILSISRQAAADTTTYAVNVVLNQARPSERLTEIHFEIGAGFVRTVQPIPFGWIVEIDNDPSYRSIVSGKAIVGGNFLSPRALSIVRLCVEEGPLDYRMIVGASQTVVISGHATLYLNDRWRGITLQRSEIVVRRVPGCALAPKEIPAAEGGAP